MTGLPLADLPPARQVDVLDALAAVETADNPVTVEGFRALLDPSLRATLERCLGEHGRVLLRIGSGYLSGYDDRIGQRLAAAGIGVLRPDDRAVLALVLLHSVAIPRSAGRIRGHDWTDGEPVHTKQLLKSKVPDVKVRAALQRLREAGILGYGVHHSYLPGPQLARLTAQVSETLWENMILLAQPHGVMADVIRRRRLARRQQTTQNGEIL
ncbi:hypothetical protein BJY24_001045 [Nocardia transvalensis]|uniref:Uncharacterized protein n=1 Tax=Nocardia transvalensis TaxID=37333 RepID=A0A7W9PAI8_9NOCA|nr:hypothetical protein [Nocardia transvalensis]MBB5912178.1 hypothetical protein [Nocardia transvalensis]